MFSWNLTKEQEETLQKVIKGKAVWDLGAGNCSLARKMIELGATYVHAVDCKPYKGKPLGKKIRFINAYFSELSPTMYKDQVVMGSWVHNTKCHGIMSFLRQAETIVLLGNNFDGTITGMPSIYEETLMRELLHYTPDPKNCLLVVGKHRQVGKFLGVKRDPTPFEAAGMDMVNMRSYKKMHKNYEELK